MEVETFDAVVVGAGLCGLDMLRQLKIAGFRVKLYEAGTGPGGIWHWNRYPGARVDTDHQVYQFMDIELSNGFSWSKRFPDYIELQKYFKYVEEKLNLSKDIQFSTRVTAGTFDDSRNQWLVTTDNGTSTWTSHLILCTGFASKSYTPPFEGLEDFKGEKYHSNAWPKDGVQLEGKRVSIIGTGASGVQIIQEIGPVASHLTVYQRTPNLALPMRQYAAGEESKWHLPEQDQLKVFGRMPTTFAGLNMDMVPINAVDCTPEEREAFYEKLYTAGGLAFWLGTYQDIFYSEEANDTAYQFWCKKTRARISNPIKRDLLAPLKAPHHFGTKRPSLEQRYFEVMDQNNVDIINLRESKIIRIRPEGVETELEGLVKTDVLILATGFDSVTGGILNIDIRNGESKELRDKWRNGVLTHLGLMTAGYPNLFFVYGPQSLSGFASGPTAVAVQGGWITQLLVHMRESKLTRVDTRTDVEQKWSKIVQDVWNASLFPLVDSWYHGANIPGKPREALSYAGGLPAYTKEVQRVTDNNYEGFVLS